MNTLINFLINILTGSLGLILMLMALYALGLIYQLKIFKPKHKRDLYKYSFNLSDVIFMGVKAFVYIIFFSFLIFMLWRFGEIIIIFKHYLYINN